MSLCYHDVFDCQMDRSCMTKLLLCVQFMFLLKQDVLISSPATAVSTF